MSYSIGLFTYATFTRTATNTTIITTRTTTTTIGPAVIDLR